MRLAVHLLSIIVIGTLTILLANHTRTTSLPAELGRAEEAEIAKIAVEHSAPIGISLELSTKANAGMLAVSHDSTEAVPVSLPESWKRGEVRDASLSSITADEPVFGFRRWIIPVGASVTFEMDTPPGILQIHNPSKIPLKVQSTRIDLETETINRSITLIKDEPAQL